MCAHLPTPAEFWRSRLRRNGHTGWDSPEIYAFDQIARLEVFGRWLEAAALAPGKALDFGCGTGDFSRLLAERGWSVIAYDKFMVPEMSSPCVETAATFEQALALAPFDLVVSVTVLDHIVDEAEFDATLAALRRAMRPGAHFFFLEYSPADALPASTYQAFRPMAAWRRSLKQAGLMLEVTVPHFHPTVVPVPAWRAYRLNPQVWSLHKLERLTGWRTPLEPRLRAAMKSLARYPFAPPPASSPINVLSGRTHTPRLGGA